MNQLYRALHMPPQRLLRKLTGEKEIYTIAVRPLPAAEGAEPLPALGAAPPFALLPDEPFNLQHREFDLVSRNAGPLFVLGGQVIHPTQVSTRVDYGVYLQFLARRGSSEVPLCAALPQSVTIAGVDPRDIIGIHTYCRDDVLEIIDGRYLTKVKTSE